LHRRWKCLILPEIYWLNNDTMYTNVPVATRGRPRMNPSWHIVLCNVGGANAAKDATRTNIEAACAFKPTAAGAEENYIGTVHYRGVGKEVLTAKVVPLRIPNHLAVG
jgi:hypothetical protein